MVGLSELSWEDQQQIQKQIRKRKQVEEDQQIRYLKGVTEEYQKR
jgi:hypothetical protein